MLDVLDLNPIPKVVQSTSGYAENTWTRCNVQISLTNISFHMQEYDQLSVVGNNGTNWLNESDVNNLPFVNTTYLEYDCVNNLGRPK